MSICKYFQIHVDPQVLENTRVFDSRLWVTWWLKPAWIQVWHFEFEIPAGMDLGHPQVHLCSALACANPDAANCLLTGRIRVNDHLVNIRKDLAYLYGVSNGRNTSTFKICALESKNVPIVGANFITQINATGPPTASHVAKDPTTPAHPPHVLRSWENARHLTVGGVVVDYRRSRDVSHTTA